MAKRIIHCDACGRPGPGGAIKTCPGWYGGFVPGCAMKVFEAYCPECLDRWGFPPDTFSYEHPCEWYDTEPVPYVKTVHRVTLLEKMPYE